jgi:hypothetical protein
VLIHDVEFSLFWLLLLAFGLLGDFLELLVLDLLVDSVDGDNEVKQKEKHDDALQEKGANVVLSGHSRGERQVRGIGYAFGCCQEEIHQTHSSLSNYQ